MSKNQESLGQFEHIKFAEMRERYRQSLPEILSLGFDDEDYIHQFPAFTGPLTLARFLTFYEAYKMTLGVAGHIAEVGVFKGAVSLFLAKLIQLHEPYALTQVHGFDWFKGAETTSEEKYVKDGECKADYERLMKLIKLQNMQTSIHIHKLDVTTQLREFFDSNSHLQFKFIFLDCGIYEVVKQSIKYLWPRLTKGGIMMFDQFNHEFAPGETRAVKEMLPDVEIRTFPNGWMPTAYLVK